MWEQTLPACFESFEFLYKERLQELSTLVKRRVAGIVVAAVVEDFGHVRYELCEFAVKVFLYPLLHRRQV